jgi:hypothetical protein
MVSGGQRRPGDRRGRIGGTFAGINAMGNVFGIRPSPEAWDLVCDDDLWNNPARSGELFERLKSLRANVIDAPFRIIDEQPEPKRLDAPRPE